MGARCECPDPWHRGEPCRNTTDSVESWAPGVKASPALCMGCLFGCEDFSGTGHQGGVMAKARMMLACQRCGERWPDDAVMEAVKLHVQVEHDTDDVRLDLIVVCACNARMDLTRVEPLRNGRERHYYDCPGCKRSTNLTAATPDASETDPQDTGEDT